MIFLKLCQLLLKWPIFVVSPKGNLDFLDPKKFNNIDHINNFSFETINRRLLNFGFLKNLLQLNNIDEILFRRFMILVFCALTKMFVRSPPLWSLFSFIGSCFSAAAVTAASDRDALKLENPSKSGQNSLKILKGTLKVESFRVWFVTKHVYA